jgi:hypothetical protein
MALTIIPKYSGTPLEPTGQISRLSTPVTWCVQGLTGTQGMTGIQGTQGIQGIQGLQGIQGTEGMDISIGTSTIEITDYFYTEDEIDSFKFIKEGSLGTDFYWDASNYLECSCGSGGGEGYSPWTSLENNTSLFDGDASAYLRFFYDASGNYLVSMHALEVDDISDPETDLPIVNEYDWILDASTYYEQLRNDYGILGLTKTYVEGQYGKASLGSLLWVNNSGNPSQEAYVEVKTDTTSALATIYAECSSTQCQINVNAEETLGSTSMVGFEVYDDITETENEFSLFHEYAVLGRKDTQDGSIFLYGTIYADSNSRLTMRPTAIPGKFSAAGGGAIIPTNVDVGAYNGYSLPNWTAGSDEELFYKEYAPGRWNGTSDITATVICALASADASGNKFALQLSWANKTPTSGVISTLTQDVSVVTTVTDSRKAANSIYKVEFTIDYDASVTIKPSDTIGFRIRKQVPPSNPVTSEIIVLDFLLTYQVDKVYKRV